MPRLFQTCQHTFSSWLSFGIQFVNINRITFEKRNGKEFVSKSRTPLSAGLISTGNFVFRNRRVPIRVLHRNEWIDWEKSVNQALGNDSISDSETSPKRLFLNRIPGQPIGTCMNQSTDVATKLQMVASATDGLWNLHQHSLDGWPLSHADASVQNVMFDRETGNTQWFDFDLRHSGSTKAVARHADDLRALAFTAVTFFTNDSVAQLADTLIQNYPTPEVWSEWIDQSPTWFSGDVFHRAQIHRAKRSNKTGSKICSRIELELAQSIGKALKVRTQ